MKIQINTCERGSEEYITQPNAYDIYKIIEGELMFERREQVEEESFLYCRNCGKEINNRSLLNNEEYNSE